MGRFSGRQHTPQSRSSASSTVTSTNGAAALFGTVADAGTSASADAGAEEPLFSLRTTPPASTSSMDLARFRIRIALLLASAHEAWIPTPAKPPLDFSHTPRLSVNLRSSPVSASHAAETSSQRRRQLCRRSIQLLVVGEELMNVGPSGTGDKADTYRCSPNGSTRHKLKLEEV